MFCNELKVQGNILSEIIQGKRSIIQQQYTHEIKQKKGKKTRNIKRIIRKSTILFSAVANKKKL
jgi:hypothetical protein